MKKLTINKDGLDAGSKHLLLDIVAKIAVNYYEERMPLYSSTPIEFGRLLEFFVTNCISADMNGQYVFINTDVDYKLNKNPNPSSSQRVVHIKKGKEFFEGVKSGLISYISSLGIFYDRLSVGTIIVFKCDEYKSIYPNGIYRKLSYFHGSGYSFTKLSKSEFESINK